jgi:hypothetical protein
MCTRLESETSSAGTDAVGSFRVLVLLISCLRFYERETWSLTAETIERRC